MNVSRLFCTGPCSVGRCRVARAWTRRAFRLGYRLGRLLQIGVSGSMKRISKDLSLVGGGRRASVLQQRPAHPFALVAGERVAA